MRLSSIRPAHGGQYHDRHRERRREDAVRVEPHGHEQDVANSANTMDGMPESVSVNSLITLTIRLPGLEYSCRYTAAPTPMGNGYRERDDDDQTRGHERGQQRRMRVRALTEQEGGRYVAYAVDDDEEQYAHEHGGDEHREHDGDVFAYHAEQPLLPVNGVHAAVARAQLTRALTAPRVLLDEAYGEIDDEHEHEEHEARRDERALVRAARFGRTPSPWRCWWSACGCW